MSEWAIVVVKHKCDPSGASFNSDKELCVHSESDHKGMPSPEKERSIASCSVLQISPIHMQRDEDKLSEQEAAPSPVPITPPPPTFFKCDYWILGTGPCGIFSGGTFNCKSDLRRHMHEVHGQCLDFHLPNPPPCPLPGCK